MVNNIISKGIILGDYTNPPYHPLKDVDVEIKGIFQEEIEFEATEDYSMLNYEKLNNYHLLVLYTDCFSVPQPKAYINSIIKYVENGGNLLVIHNGISLQEDEAFVDLIGARFTGHPDYTELKISVKEPKHPISEGIDEFIIPEEPYRYELKEDDNKLIILDYTHEGQIYPAAWCKFIGKGKLVYLMPGHNLASFKNENYRKIIYQSGKWLLQKIN